MLIKKKIKKKIEAQFQTNSTQRHEIKKRKGNHQKDKKKKPQQIKKANQNLQLGSCEWDNLIKKQITKDHEAQFQKKQR